jgi:hypothetical protein
MKTLIAVIAMMMTMSVHVHAIEYDELTDDDRNGIWGVADMTITCAVLIRKEHPDVPEIAEYTYDLMIGAVEMYEISWPGQSTPESLKKSVEDSAEWYEAVPRETIERILNVCYSKILKVSAKDPSELQLNLDYTESLSM